MTIKVGDTVYVPESVTLPGGFGEGDALKVLSVGAVVRFRVLAAHFPSRNGSEYEVATDIVVSLIEQGALTVVQA